MTINTNTIDHATLEHLVEAGAVRGANIVGQPGGWGVVIQYGMTERVLAAKRGAIRVFRKFETLVSYLKGIGITRYQVDASLFDPDALKTVRTRLDASNRMKTAHEAVEHEIWFREQVNQALIEAAAPDTKLVSQEDANASWAALRTKFSNRVGGTAA